MSSIVKDTSYDTYQAGKSAVLEWASNIDLEETISGWYEGSWVESGVNAVSNAYDNSNLSSVMDVIFDSVSGVASDLTSGNLLQSLTSVTTSIFGNSGFLGGLSAVISEILGTLSSATVYTDGISETAFGAHQESTWRTFMSAISNGTNKARFISDTPLSSSTSGKQRSVYGSLILGTPPLWDGITDPGNRASTSSFVKDMRFLSLTPGMPRFNGGYSEQLLYSLRQHDTYKHQTKTFNEMIEYLKRNGLDDLFNQKDKRYYTFDPKFSEYFVYLETMLNTVWIKLGLSQNGSETLDLMSFFNRCGSGIDESLKSEYKSSLGFYIQGAPQVSESLDNESFSAGLEADTNAASEQMQQLNYLTGMGNYGNSIMGGVKRASRAVSGVYHAYETFRSNILEPLKPSGDGNIAKKLAQIAKNVLEMNATNDPSALIQQFNVGNGMKVKYPSLWGDSHYGKNMNFDFEFYSPYGDPLSIFHYVYVPFFALLTFTLPRQADQNGYVSPFFVRADIPGHMTTDLAMISNITWTRGGPSGNLFTKDGLPRSIHVSISLLDLFPYLSMTKRISFLSANPAYTSFLDTMAGLHAIENGSDNDELNRYLLDALNRASGTGDYTGLARRSSGDLANKYSNSIFSKSRSAGYNSEKTRPVSINSGKFTIPWFSKSR